MGGDDVSLAISEVETGPYGGHRLAVSALNIPGSAMDALAGAFGYSEEPSDTPIVQTINTEGQTWTFTSQDGTVTIAADRPTEGYKHAATVSMPSDDFSGHLDWATQS